MNYNQELSVECQQLQQSVLQVQKQREELQNQLAQYQAVRQGLSYQEPQQVFKQTTQLPQQIPQQIPAQLPQPPSQRPPVLEPVGSSRPIVIDGSDEFKTKVSSALDLLSEEDLALVEKHTRKIFQTSNTTGAYTNVKATAIGTKTLEKIGTKTLAGILVHEGGHHELDTENSQQQELYCIRKQINALKKMGGDSWEIQQLEAEDGLHYLRECNY